MDFASQAHTSFIPKTPIVNNTPPAYTKRSVPILTVVSFLVFIAAIALAGGVFVYKQYLTKSLEEKKTTLENTRAAFDPALIEELRRLDQRIEHSKKLLANHSAMSIIFDLLQKATLQNIQFRNFSMLATDDGKIDLRLTGLAHSYASVALQSDSFNQMKGIKNPVFSQLSLDNSGNVTFAITANLDPDVFRYTNLLSSADEADTTTTESLDQNQ